MANPITLYSVITDYGTSDQGPVAEHYGSDIERLDALINRVEHLTGATAPNVRVDDLAFLVERVLGPPARVILTEATYVSGDRWRTTTVEPRHLSHNIPR